MAAGRPERTARAVPRFLRAKKHLAEKVQEQVDAEVRGLLTDPMKGEPKKGALAGVRVWKFKVDRPQYLLAYRFFPKPNVVELLDVGTHENFYRGLQDYLTS